MDPLRPRPIGRNPTGRFFRRIIRKLIFIVILGVIFGIWFLHQQGFFG